MMSRPRLRFCRTAALLLWWSCLLPNKLLFLQAQSITTVQRSNNDMFDHTTDLVFTTADGKEYPIRDAWLDPLVGLFSPTHYTVRSNTVLQKMTNKTLDINVFRTTYEDGTVLQLYKSLDGGIRFLEIFPKDGKVTFVAKQSDDKEEYDIYSASDLDERYEFHDDGVAVPVSRYSLRGPFGQGQRHVGHGTRRVAAQSTGRRVFDFTLGDGSSAECKRFNVIHVAVAYDEEFCQMYSSKYESEQIIQAVVAGASLYYEHDTCSKLNLVSIIEPKTCDPSQSTFIEDRSVDRDNACNGGNGNSFLYVFARQMRRDRHNHNLENNVAVHLFSGYTAKAELGCSYTGTYCDENWAYGVNYMSFSPDDLAPQIVVFAHELAHTLGVPHYEDAAQGGEFIMAPHISTGEEGFSENSVGALFDHLDATNCKSTVPAKRTITAAVLFPGNKVYFFYNQANVAMYAKYDLETTSVDPGRYPRPVVGHWGDSWPNSNWWPTGGFVTATQDEAYFFNSENGSTRATYLRYSLDSDEVESGFPKDMSRWEGLPPDVSYQAAVLFPGNKLYLFDGDEYYKFDMNEGKADSDEYPRKIAKYWDNWPSGFEATGGFVTLDQMTAYFFGFQNDDGEALYIRYSIQDGMVDSGYPRDVKSGWPGVLD